MLVMKLQFKKINQEKGDLRHQNFGDDLLERRKYCLYLKWVAMEIIKSTRPDFIASLKSQKTDLS